MMMHKLTLGLLVPLVLAGLPMQSQAAKKGTNIDIDQALLLQTRKIQDAIKKAGAKTVGVVKFYGQIGKKAGFQIAPITSQMAERLEHVLVMARTGKKGLDYDVIRDASGEAAKAKKKLSWRGNLAKRQALFDLKYPLYLGSTKKSPDLLFTGVVKMDPKSKKTKVMLIAFTKKDKALNNVVSNFSMTTTRTLLADAGRSFLIRPRSGLVEEDNSELLDLLGNTDANERDENDQQQDTNTDLTNIDDTIQADKNAYAVLKMMIKRAGQEQPQEVPYEEDPEALGAGGRFKLSKENEPKEGDEVYFVIENKHSARIAVVLKVNQENTIYQQIDDAKDCSKWVLDPGETLTVEGYYTQETDLTTNKNKVNKFKVLSDAESELAYQSVSQEPLAQGMGQIGTIQMWVYTANTGGGGGGSDPGLGKKFSLRSLSGKELAKARKTIRTYRDLQSRLMKNMQTNRGLLAANDVVEDGAKLETVSFENPVEVQHTHIKYYYPGQIGGLSFP